MDCKNCNSTEAKLWLVGDDEYLKLCEDCYRKFLCKQNRVKALKRPVRHKMIEEPEKAKGHNIAGYVG